MKTLAFILCLVASALASSFDSIGEEIAHLTADVINFEHFIDARIDQATVRYNRLLDNVQRVETIEGSDCDLAHEFQCGGTTPYCLSRLLVCDGEVDCPNGADESQCRPLTPVGSTWKGDFVYDFCTATKPDHFTLTITDFQTNQALLSVPQISAELYIEDEMKDFSYSSNLHLHGAVDLRPGAQAVMFRHPKSNGLGFKCTFDRVHDDHCHGEVFYLSSQETCAEFVMERTD